MKDSLEATGLNSLGNFRLLVRRVLQSTVARNAFSLYSFRFSNYLLQLVTIPYLVRVLGAESFGLLGFAQGLVNSFAVVVDYGFDWSATREISTRRENIASVSRVAMSIWGAKICLCLLCLMALLPVTLLVAKVRMAALLVWALTGIMFGRVLFPTWLFQGLERMGAIAAINVSIRAIGLLALILLVRGPNDLLACAIILSGQAFLTGACGAVFAFLKFQIRLVAPSWRDIMTSLKDGWALFLSSGASILYLSGNAFILGMLVPDISVVGYYDAAERLVRVAMDPLGPIYQAFFPRINKLAHASKELTLREGRKVLALLVPLGIAIFAVMMVGSPIIVRLVFGAKFMASAGILRILSFNVLNLALAAVWSTLMMMSFKRDYAVVKILLGAGLVNVGLAFLLVPAYGAKGMAACVVAAETFVNVSSFLYTLKHGLNPLRLKVGQQGD